MKIVGRRGQDGKYEVAFRMDRGVMENRLKIIDEKIAGVERSISHYISQKELLLAEKVAIESTLSENPED